MLQDFVHLHIDSRTHIFSISNAPDLLWKGSHIHICSVVFVISIMLMDVFICPYSFVNINVIIPVHFYYFMFCFRFYFPIVNIIVSRLYLLFLCLRKTNTKCCDKNEKNPQWYHPGVDGKICSYKYCLLHIKNIFFQFLYEFWLYPLSV